MTNALFYINKFLCLNHAITASILIITRLSNFKFSKINPESSQILNGSNYIQFIRILNSLMLV